LTVMAEINMEVDELTEDEEEGEEEEKEREEEVVVPKEEGEANQHATAADGLSSESEADTDVDFDAIADQAVRALSSRIKPLVELGLDVGISADQLYLKGKDSISGMFNTASVSGQRQIHYRDFEDGLHAMAPKQATFDREVRGAPVRPNDDTKLKKKERKKEKEKSLDGWFGLPKQTLTPQLKMELKAIQLRGSFDPKRFYKANDSKELPKYFTIATEVGGGMAAAGEKATVHDRHPRSGQSFLQSVLRDDRVQEWTTKKAAESNARGQASRFSGHGNPNRGKVKRGGKWKKTKKS